MHIAWIYRGTHSLAPFRRIGKSNVTALFKPRGSPPISGVIEQELTKLRHRLSYISRMGKLQARAGVWLSILLASSVCAFALDPSLDVSQYGHTAWKIREGFTKGTIFSMAQTPD